MSTARPTAPRAGSKSLPARSNAATPPPPPCATSPASSASKPDNYPTGPRSQSNLYGLLSPTFGSAQKQAVGGIVALVPVAVPELGQETSQRRFVLCRHLQAHQHPSVVR